MNRHWSARGKRRFEALQHAVVPISASFDEAERRTSLELVDRTLAAQSAAVRRQIGWFLAAVDGYCLIRYGHVFRRLPCERRQRVLDSLFEARAKPLRQGMDGLATLAKLGAYGQPELHSRLGYRLRENPGD